MRPVRLDLHGFAAFREPTVVDFTGAEYFALVGPTGAGKSTIIDAITFALYGSVPRWDNQRTVSLALAPTAGRGTVSLLFDVGGARYVAARELRRAASGAVSVRSARLERLRDPSGDIGSETEPLADGAGGVTEAVEQLLGLPFGDFTTCVVLPQGEFAEFLHTEPRKRQEKLVRILGLGVYDRIAREANTEAAAQRQRAEVLAEQLGAYADATPEAAAAGLRRVTELTALEAEVDALVPALAAAAGRAEAGEREVAELLADAARLGALTLPAGLADLDARRESADAALAAAGESADAAEAADSAARERLVAAPARGALELVRARHAELAELVAELPGARDRRAKARAACDTAGQDAAEARATLDTARAALDTAVAAAGAAQELADRIAAERGRLAALVVPAGLAALERRRAAAVAARERAGAALAAAEEVDVRARDAVAGAPARGQLEQARRELVERERAAGALAGAERALAAADADAAAMGEAVAHGRDELDHARGHLADAQQGDLAAALRPALVAGEHCPVCAQGVVTLPAPLPATDLEGARRAVTEAERAHEQARRAETGAVTARAREAAEVERLGAEVARLEASLATVRVPGIGTDAVRGPAARSGSDTGAGPDDHGDIGSGAGPDPVAGAVPGAGAVPEAVAGPVSEAAQHVGSGQVPSAAAVDAALAWLDDLADAARDADTAVRAARREGEGADRAAEAVRAEVAAIAAALRGARDPLVALGAPVVDSDDVPAGWAALVGWAGEQVAERDAALPGARDAVAAADDRRAAAEQAVGRADRVATDARAGETAAARAEQEAGLAVTRTDTRIAVLRTALDGARSDAEAAAELERLAELERATAAADTALRGARVALRAAERVGGEVAGEVAAAWDGLRAVRDPLVRLGAPAVAGTDVRAAWTTLHGWATDAAAERRGQLAAAREAVDRAAAERAGAQERLRAALTAHELDAAEIDGAAERAPSTVARERERARSAHERLVERRAAAGRLAEDRAAAEEAGQVAKMLGGLLRSDAFPRWLVASALDALVADASASLAELSGGQFELTHAGGEFLVVDHADADSRRPVKTLSGGETFQASLALALALSAQMSGLAASGAARLESIFLDEGFGTLDEANLEVVAGTLEALAARGDRMVGVVTHVPALAERVPVRFVVQRDQRTSSVVREDR